MSRWCLFPVGSSLSPSLSPSPRLHSHLAALALPILTVHPHRHLRPRWRLPFVGRYTFLTVQTNFLGTLYFGAAVGTVVLDAAVLDVVVVRLFPVMFALGVFLTLAYVGCQDMPSASALCPKKHAPTCLLACGGACWAGIADWSGNG